MRNFNILWILFLAGMVISCKSDPGWKLVWEDDFDKDGVIDESVWSKIPRGRADWSRHMSNDEALYEVKDSKLILRGMVNPGLPGDTMPFLTGGIYTKNKKGFYRGRIEISAKLGNAQGAWPALWLLPFDNTPWPYGGEIDMMERLNYDAVVHHNVHTFFTKNSRDTGQRGPRTSATVPIRNGEFNTYGMEMYPDSIVWLVNGERTFSYPRIETDLTWGSAEGDGQFPFDKPFFLLLDMQLGGNWVGEVNPNDLPVEMHIDWVRFYEWK